MREAERLDKFYDRLKELHKEYCPDWRFGQLMSNFADAVGDIYHWEEDALIEVIEEYMKKTFGLSDKEKKMFDAIEATNNACAGFNDCDHCPIHNFFEEDEECCIPDLQVYLSGKNHGAK